MDNAASTIRAWLLQVMQDRQMTPNAWAKAAGVSPTTITRAIKNDYQFVTSSRTLAKLAAVASAVPPDLGSSDRLPHIDPQFLPVRFKVQAGNWIEAEDYVQAFTAQFPVAPDPRFSGFPQWLELVVGDSVDRKIADGAYAHVVDAIALGYSARTSDFVVVERTRNGGFLRERSIKQVVVLPSGRVQLWPRSTNPRWSEPLAIADGLKESEEAEVRIVGLVIGSYTPL